MRRVDPIEEILKRSEELLTEIDYWEFYARAAKNAATEHLEAIRRYKRLLEERDVHCTDDARSEGVAI